MLRRAKSKQKRQLEKSLYDLSTRMGAKPVASYEELIQQSMSQFLNNEPFNFCTLKLIIVTGANPYLAPPKQAKSHLAKVKYPFLSILLI